MLPLGIDGTRAVVVCDRSATHFSAPRVWFIITTFGIPDVRVLDGGLTAWTDAGQPVVTGPADRSRSVVAVNWSLDYRRVIDEDALRDMVAAGRDTILDARSTDRFAGRAPEPWAGLRSGYMPGARCVPFTTFTRGGRFLSPTDNATALPDMEGAQTPLRPAGPA